jgi:hypothetical protein
LIHKDLVAVYNSEVITPSLFIDAFGVTEDGVFAIVERLQQETPGCRVLNTDVEQVLLQYYAQEEAPEGRSIDDVFAGMECYSRPNRKPEGFSSGSCFVSALLLSGTW